VGDERQQTDSSTGLTAAAANNQEAGAQATRVPILSDVDIVRARQLGRELAAQLGFSPVDLTLVATAISELARNIVLYAKQGEISLQIVEQGGKRGIVVTARDEGPGITDVSRALQAGYSTSRSLGLGLPGVKRLMDEFEIVSRVLQGTTVTVKKWRW
jgi:serine/threonine-protein kinase RsbT